MFGKALIPQLSWPWFWNDNLVVQGHSSTSQTPDLHVHPIHAHLRALLHVWISPCCPRSFRLESDTREHILEFEQGSNELIVSRMLLAWNQIVRLNSSPFLRSQLPLLDAVSHRMWWYPWWYPRSSGDPAMSIFLVPLFHDGPALFISFTQKNAAEPAETWGEMQGLYCTWIPCCVALVLFSAQHRLKR